MALSVIANFVNRALITSCVDDKLYTHTDIHCVSKNRAKLFTFCQTFVKFPPVLTIFDRKMANRLKVCELHLFSTSPNLCHHATVLNADVPNCHTTLYTIIISIRLHTGLTRVQIPGYIPKKTRRVFWVHRPKKPTKNPSKRPELNLIVMNSLITCFAILKL